MLKTSLSHLYHQSRAYKKPFYADTTQQGFALKVTTAALHMVPINSKLLQSLRNVFMGERIASLEPLVNFCMKMSMRISLNRKSTALQLNLLHQTKRPMKSQRNRVQPTTLKIKVQLMKLQIKVQRLKTRKIKSYLSINTKSKALRKQKTLLTLTPNQMKATLPQRKKPTPIPPTVTS